MANLFLDLPVPAGVGVGASVDTSALGATRTVTLTGSGFASVAIDISQDGTNWAELTTFGALGGKRTLAVSAAFMRVRVINKTSFGAVVIANCDVASDDSGTVVATLPVPAGTGVGAPVDVSGLLILKTALVTGQRLGSVILESSPDGVTFSDAFTFGDPGGVQSKEFVAQFMRARRIATANPGPVVAQIGGAVPVGGGGGGGGGLPPFIGVLNAVLRENPLGVASWGKLTQDDILPPFNVTLSIAAGTTREVGNQLVDPVLTASYTGGTPIAATIDDSGGPAAPVPLIAPFASGTLIATYNSAAGAAGNNTSQAFDITADSADVTGKTDTATLFWRPRVFWEAKDAAAYDAAFILALANSALAANRNRTINYTGGTPASFLYYAIPSSYGTPTFTVGGFAGGFELAASAISVSNGLTPGNTQDYDLWKSINPGLTPVTVVVT
jgi:hypothetical protein